MTILDQALSAAGGVSALARLIGVSPTAIQNWKTRGIPDSWAKVLTLMQRHGDGVFSAHVTNVIGPEQIIGAMSNISS